MSAPATDPSPRRSADDVAGGVEIVELPHRRRLVNGIPSDVMFGRIQKCRPVRSQTTANDGAHDEDDEEQTEDGEARRNLFFIHIGASGKRHMSTMANAARPSKMEVQDIGRL